MLMCFSDSWLFGSHGCIGFGWRLRIRTQSISLGWRVMMRIDAHFLHMFAVPQQACHLQDGESQCSEATRPKDDDQDHDKLGCNSTATDAGLAGSIIILHATEAAPTMVMVNAPAPIEQTCSDEPPGTAEAVYWAGIHWVINLELLQQHGSSRIHKTANQTSGKSTATFHITTACGDGHQARQDPIAQSTHIILLCDDVSEQEDGDATCCCSQGGVHCYLSSKGTITSRFHGQGRAWVEAIPAEPQSESAKDHQWQVVALKLLVCINNPVAPMGWPHVFHTNGSSSQKIAHPAVLGMGYVDLLLQQGCCIYTVWPTRTTQKAQPPFNSFFCKSR